MTTTQSLSQRAQALALRARVASRALAAADTETKNRALRAMADAIDASHEELLAANARDVEAARLAGTTGALVDRLVLNGKRLADVSASLRDIADLPDPVGEVSEKWTRPNGMSVSRVHVPLGVVLVIYEARPNVTADAAALCLKSGNSVILRGGREALNSNLALGRVLSEALRKEGLPEDSFVLVDDPDRELMLALLQQDELIDLAIPRGGEGLIRFVAEHARVPVIKHYKGVCHLYVDSAADIDMAVDLAFNGKVSRPGVCNAIETLVVHEAVAESVLPRIAKRLGDAGVEFRGDEAALPLLAPAPNVKPATRDDFGKEFLDLILAVRVVRSFDEAIDHIERYGSQHSEVIVTSDEATARAFQRQVDASYVGWNVSSRFNDGGQLGLGAEMGISTTKLHAYGPMGLRELTTRRFVVEGEGQIRE